MPSHFATVGAAAVHPGTLGQCRQCSSVRQARRPPRQARGYGGSYDANANAVVTSAIDAALAGAPLHCPKCGEPCLPGQALTAGHQLAIRDGGTNELANLAAEHAACNYGWRRGSRRGGRR